MTTKPDQDLVQRILMSLVEDAVAAEETAARIRTQVEAMAKEYGVKVPGRE